MWHILGTGEVHTGCLVGDLMERDNLEELCGDGRIIIKWNFKEVEWGGTDWIALTQDSDRWRALVNAVIDFRVSQNLGKEGRKGNMWGFMMYTLHRILSESAK
jgi:hypothetical protein